MWTLLAIAWGATPTIRSVPGDHDTIAEAVAAASAGDIIRVEPKMNRQAYAEAVTIDRAVTIEGINGRPLLSSTGSDGFFRVENAAVTVVIRNVEIDGGGAHRAIRQVGGALLVDDVVFARTDANPEDGGAILTGAGAAALTVTHSRFEDSEAYNGGMIAVKGGAVTITDSTFTGGTTGRHGGQVYVEGSGAVTITGSTFADGTAQRGGALHLRTAGGVTVTGSGFTGNTASDSRGGAIYLEGPSSHALLDNLFQGNEATGSIAGGGAVYQHDGAGRFEGNTWCGNLAHEGGALYVHEGTADLDDEVWLGNTADDRGGALWVRDGSATVRHASFALNSAPDGHAAGAANTSAELILENSYVADHGNGAFALHAAYGTVSTERGAYWRNLGGDWNDETTIIHDPKYSNMLGVDPLIPTPSRECDRNQLAPPHDSPLVNAGTDGDTIGALDPLPPPDTGGDPTLPGDTGAGAPTGTAPPPTGDTGPTGSRREVPQPDEPGGCSCATGVGSASGWWRPVSAAFARRR